jgi:hypothetical protein
MQSNSSQPKYTFVGALLALPLLAGATVHSNHSFAAGALAVALPPDVVKGGFSYGYSNDNADAATADSKAMNACRSTKDATKDAKLRALCKVIQDYNKKCVAVAMDPQAGTPGVGWAVADDKRAAEHDALMKCEATAGPGRAAACVVDHSGCDGSAK